MRNRHVLISVRDFVFSVVNKEFLIFLFFLCLSGIFWLMMTLNETYEKEYEVALRLSGQPNNVVLTTEPADTIRFVVRDKGFVLLSYSSSHRLRPLTFNFKTYAKSSYKGKIPMADIQKAISQQLFASTTLVSVKSESTNFTYNYGERKLIPITLAGEIKPGQSYYIARIDISPKKATVYAQHQQLDSLKFIPTESLSIINIQDTVIKTVNLAKINGVKVVPEKVNIKIYPDVLTEESVEVPIKAINMPEGTILRTFPQRVRILFTAGASMVRNIKAHPESFIVTADYNDFGKEHTEKCQLTLHTKPRSVHSARLEISQIDYLIEQQ